MSDKGWARTFARMIVGMTFFMAGWGKCFNLTPMVHAQRGFVEPYAETWIPTVLLWALGLSIPVIELTAGALLIVGWRTREALITIGCLLVMVTYGHLLIDGRFAITEHILPRGLLMLAALALPASEDLYSVDGWLQRSKRA